MAHGMGRKSQNKLLQRGTCEIDGAFRKWDQIQVLEMEFVFPRRKVKVFDKGEVERLIHTVFERLKASHAPHPNPDPDGARYKHVPSRRLHAGFTREGAQHVHGSGPQFPEPRGHLPGGEEQGHILAVFREGVHVDDQRMLGHNALQAQNKPLIIVAACRASTDFRGSAVGTACPARSVPVYSFPEEWFTGREELAMRWLVRGGAALLVGLVVWSSGAGARVAPEAVLRKRAGNYYLKLRQYEKARDEYLAALQISPDFPEAHYNLGVVYFFRLKDYPRALYHFVRYATLRPDASDLDQVRELVFQALRRIEQAEREAYAKALREGTPDALERYIRRYPDSPYVEDARRKLRALREYEKAKGAWEQESRRAYERAVAAGTPEAIEVFLARYPDSPQADEARRLLELRRERAAEAERAFRDAMEAGTVEALASFLGAYPDSPHATEAQARLDHLKAARSAFGIAREARSVGALERFLEAYPDVPEAAEAERLLEALRREEQEEERKDNAAPPHQDTPPPSGARAAPALPSAGKGDAAWAEAERAHTAQAYETFRRRYPDHPMAEEARRRAAALRTEEENPSSRAKGADSDDQTRADWEAARRTDTAEAYRSFLQAHPEGKEAEEARRRLEDLERRVQQAEGKLSRDKRKALERYRRMLQGQ